MEWVAIKNIKVLKSTFFRIYREKDACPFETLSTYLGTENWPTAVVGLMRMHVISFV